MESSVRYPTILLKRLNSTLYTMTRFRIFFHSKLAYQVHIKTVSNLAYYMIIWDIILFFYKIDFYPWNSCWFSHTVIDKSPYVFGNEGKSCIVMSSGIVL